MKLNTDGLFDVSLAHRKNLSLAVGLCFLFSAILDLIQGKSWILSGRLHWLGSLIVEWFGGYGVIVFEFGLAVFCLYRGFTMKAR
ncbi:MAG: hypothetical protein LBS89_07885 [Zoogloeaceae bacterium]|jgi:hypothetical protein|nr:hypothetical protein [Zoogloeaceae bacterium]